MKTRKSYSNYTKEEMEVLINDRASELKMLNRKISKIEDELDELREKYNAKFGYEYAGINIKERAGSYILTRPDGIALFVPKKKNAYNERHVYWYDVKKRKKLDKALEFTRLGKNKLALWLKDLDVEETPFQSEMKEAEAA